MKQPAPSDPVDSCSSPYCSRCPCRSCRRVLSSARRASLCKPQLIIVVVVDSLPARRSFPPSNHIHTAGRSIPVLFRLLRRHANPYTVGPGLDPDSFLVDETSVAAAVLVDEIERVAREVVGVAAGHTFDEVGILVSYGEGRLAVEVSPGIDEKSSVREEHCGNRGTSAYV